VGFTILHNLHLKDAEGEQNKIFVSQKRTCASLF
jgi:hypothetical protein